MGARETKDENIFQLPVLDSGNEIYICTWKYDSFLPDRSLIKEKFLVISSRFISGLSFHNESENNRSNKKEVRSIEKFYQICRDFCRFRESLFFYLE